MNNLLKNEPSCGEITVMIFDDDLPSVEILRDSLSMIPDVKVVATASTLAGARRLLEGPEPDLVFLDIEFPDGSGLDLFADDRNYGETRFVFYTVYSKYFHEAFRLHAFDYLLKPFEPDEVRLIIERFRLDGRLPGLTAADVRCQIPSRGEARSIAITTITNDKVILPPSSILFFKYDSDRKIWESVLTTLERHILKRHTTAELILSYGDCFVRTHKSYIINIDYLGLITGNECRLLPPFNDLTEIKISKNYRRPLLDRFYDL